MKTSSKRYHYDIKHGVRMNKGEKMTRLFTFEEEYDRNRIQSDIKEMPSPRGTNWSFCIQHRLRMMENGIEAYTARSYARLRLDKLIEWHRAIDLFAGRLVNHKPALIFFGCRTVAPNSPIRIKKHVRCPGDRKIDRRLQETRQLRHKNGRRILHVTNCFGRFHPHTKSYRYILCADCRPDQRAMLPTLIVTNVSKRALQTKRAIERTWREMRDLGNVIAATLTQSNTRRLVSKKQRFSKTWQPNANLNVGVKDAAQLQQLH